MASDLRHRLSRQARLLGAALFAAMLLCGATFRNAAAARDELRTRREAAAGLAADADAIRAARRTTTPLVAAGFAERDLLQRIEGAMKSAGVPSQALRSTLPEPPRRARGATHAEVITRLQFADVSLEQVGRFCFGLTQANPELSVRALEVLAGRGSEPTQWSANLSVSYRCNLD